MGVKGRRRRRNLIGPGSHSAQAKPIQGELFQGDALGAQELSAQLAPARSAQLFAQAIETRQEIRTLKLSRFRAEGPGQPIADRRGEAMGSTRMSD